MKQLSVAAGVALSLVGGNVLAADLANTKAPAVAAPLMHNWTGLYGGVNVGYGFGANNYGYGGYMTAPATNVASYGYGINLTSPAGVIGGGGFGYNRQLNSFLVLGFEADIQASDINGVSADVTGSQTANAILSSQNYFSLDWYGTARGRIGITVPGYTNFLVFGTGGFAYGYVNNTYSRAYFAASPTGQGASGVSTIGNTQTGWAAGGGIEWSPHTFPAWSAKVDYLYTDLGSATQNYASTYSTGGQYNFTGYRATPTAFNTVRVGLNWHFNPLEGEAIVAKY